MTSDRESEFEEDLKEIYHGIVNGDLKRLQRGVDTGADINAYFRGDPKQQHVGMTPLALAAALNKVEIVKFLVSRGANVNDAFANLKTTALMTACFHGHAEIVEILLRNAADVQAVDLQGSTALGYAFGGSRSVNVIKQLLKAGIDINHRNMLGMSALLLVAGYGNDKLVKMVLNAGADANSTNDFGHSSLHLAIVGKRSQIKKLTSGNPATYGLNRRNIDVALKEWRRLHDGTLKEEDERELERVGKFMMDIGTKLGQPDQLYDNDQEVMNKRVEAVWRHRQEKLQNTKKEKKKSGKLDHFLSCAGKRKQRTNGNSTTKPFLHVDDTEEKELLPPEVQKEVSALVARCTKILQMIIAAGCEIDKMEKTFGMTALDMAILLGDFESTAVLVSMGSDADHLMKMLALSDLHEGIIAGDKKQIRELLTYDVDLDIDRPFSLFNVSHKNDEEPDDILSDGVTPLTVAVQCSQAEAYDIVKMFLKHKADMNKVGPGGSGPLAEAARIGNLKMVQVLVNNGANIEQKYFKYKDATAVTIAAMFNHLEIVQFLTDKQAKLDEATSNGRMSLIAAFENDNMQMVETLLRGSLVQNFSSKKSFPYEMAVKYQRPDRDMKAIKSALAEELRRIVEHERIEVPDTAMRKMSQKQKIPAQVVQARTQDVPNIAKESLKSTQRIDWNADPMKPRSEVIKSDPKMIKTSDVIERCNPTRRPSASLDEETQYSDKNPNVTERVEKVSVSQKNSLLQSKSVSSPSSSSLSTSQSSNDEEDKDDVDATEYLVTPRAQPTSETKPNFPKPSYEPARSSYPPPPLGSSVPSSSHPPIAESEMCSEEEWDEDGDFEEDYNPVGMKNDLDSLDVSKHKSTHDSMTTSNSSGISCQEISPKEIVPTQMSDVVRKFEAASVAIARIEELIDDDDTSNADATTDDDEVDEEEEKEVDDDEDDDDDVKDEKAFHHVVPRRTVNSLFKGRPTLCSTETDI